MSALPRIMVSSVVEGFEAIREAARRGIEAGGGEPLLVNEDFSALAASPRNACLDAVDSCDAYVVIVGDRAGFVAPSGRTVVEEEYERAVARGLPVMAFLQDRVDREAAAAAFAVRLSDFVGGHFRSSFSGPDDLERKVQSAVANVVTMFGSPTMNPEIIRSKLMARADDRGEAVLRTVAAPARDEEVVDIVRLGQKEFHDSLVALGLRPDIALFSPWNSKKATFRDNVLVIHQNRGDEPPYRYVRLAVDPAGVLEIDCNVTGRREDRRGFVGNLEIIAGDVVQAITEQFGFARAFYDLVDPYRRQQSFHFNSAIHGASHRRMVEEATHGGSISMSMHASDPAIAYDRPRQISRAVLASPQSEIARIVELLGRGMG